AASPYQTVAALIEDARRAVVAASLPAHPVRTKAEYEQVRNTVSATLVEELFQTVSLIARILTKSREVERGIKSQNSLALLGPLDDVPCPRAALLHPGSVSAAGTARATHLPRYLDGVLGRLEPLANEPGRDRTRMTAYERAAQSFADAGGTMPLTAEAT